MRIGIALPITFNLPFAIIETAAVKQNPDSSGDIALTLSADNRLAFLVLWPHARPWRLARPEPMLRELPEAERAAGILARALATHAGSAISLPQPATAANDARLPQGMAAAS